MQILRLISFVTLLLISISAWSADAFYYNFTGYTLTGTPGNDAQLTSFNALLVRDGRVAAVGNKQQLESMFPELTKQQRIDLGGRYVLPGLIDAHGHVLGLGQNLQLVDLREATSEQHAAELVANYARNNPDYEWIIGRGWNQELWHERHFPSLQSLQEISNDRPVYLTRVDGHAAWVNAKALELAGINAATLDPEGGQIIRDSNGQPTGVLIDNAMQLVAHLIPAPTIEQQQDALKLAFSHLLQHGITGVHDAGIDATTFAAYQQLAKQSQLPLRIYGMLAATEPRLPELLAAGPYFSADDKLTVRSVKIYGDGALGSRGAALLSPYHDAPSQRGLMVTSPERIQRLFQLIIAHGFQVNTHAIGDRANRIVLDAYERTFAAIGGRHLRHRIEHAQIVHSDDIPRFKQLNIIASMQPTHATSDMNMAEDRLGTERMKGAYAWQTFAQQQTIIAAGSDFPVEYANPFFGLHAAVTRQDRHNQPTDGWYAHEALTLTQALRAFTLDAAYAAGQEQQLGSLEPGKWADFIVLDQDPFAQESTQLWHNSVLATIIAGQVVYQAAD